MKHDTHEESAAKHSVGDPSLQGPNHIPWALTPKRPKGLPELASHAVHKLKTSPTGLHILSHLWGSPPLTFLAW